jgi:hypothetical protein
MRKRRSPDAADPAQRGKHELHLRHGVALVECAAPASHHPNIDRLEARIVPLNADSLKLIHAALVKASGDSKRLLYAQGKHDECIPLVYGEHARDADAPCQEAYDVFLSAGNRLAAAHTLRLSADWQVAEGRTDEALGTCNRAVAMLRSLG